MTRKNIQESRRNRLCAYHAKHTKRLIIQTTTLSKTTRPHTPRNTLLKYTTTMLHQHKGRLTIAATVISMLVMAREVETFVVRPRLGSTSTSLHPVLTRLRQSTTLKAPTSTSSSEEASKPTLKKEKGDKITKEAQEFLDALEARDSDAPGRPHLIVAQVAPSVRVAIPEEFGMEPGSLPTGKLVAALKKLGFDLVLDTNTAADLTIMEEGTELLQRLKARAERFRETNAGDSASFGHGDAGPEPLPLFTSCCPGWLTALEKMDPELAPYVSSCKSPHMMYGAFVKAYSDKLLGEPPEKVYFTSIMPCVRKRGESDRAAFTKEGVRDVDNVITTKDLGTLLRMKDINPSDLDPVDFDSPFQSDGTGTGAGQLFGATGGVMEAAVRTVYELATGSSLPRLEFEEVRGLEGTKECILPLTGEEMTGSDTPIDLRIAVCSGLGNAKTLLKKMKDGEVNYDFVEVMACPGGCINGGGQPKSDPAVIDKRLEHIYKLDRSLPRRKSHENPTVKRIYEEVGEPGGETAHKLFHVKPIYGETE